MNEKMNTGKETVWKDRKRLWCGLPWTFTVYSLYEDRLIVKKGLFTTVEDEVRLYRIRDIGIRRTLLQRIFGLGTILVCSTDTSLQDFALENIKDSENVRNQLSELVETERDRRRVGVSEITSGGPGFHAHGRPDPDSPGERM